MTAMRRGQIARVEEVTRCLPEVQDALVSILSDRRISVPELGDHAEPARPGFNVIATANLRDRGVSEMSAALKRRFNFENVPAIAHHDAEVALVRARARQALERIGQPLAPPLAGVRGRDCRVTGWLRRGAGDGGAARRPRGVAAVAG